MKMDTAQVMKTLADSLASERIQVGDLACDQLGRLASDPAIELLLAQASSADANRRAHAALAIISADPQDNCGYHDLLLSQESDRLVKLKIESALSAIRHDTGQTAP